MDNHLPRARRVVAFQKTKNLIRWINWESHNQTSRERPRWMDPLGGDERAKSENRPPKRTLIEGRPFPCEPGSTSISLFLLAVYPSIYLLLVVETHKKERRWCVKNSRRLRAWGPAVDPTLGVEALATLNFCFCQHLKQKGPRYSKWIPYNHGLVAAGTPTSLSCKRLLVRERSLMVAPPRLLAPSVMRLIPAECRFVWRINTSRWHTRVFEPIPALSALHFSRFSLFLPLQFLLSVFFFFFFKSLTV